MARTRRKTKRHGTSFAPIQRKTRHRFRYNKGFQPPWPNHSTISRKFQLNEFTQRQVTMGVGKGWAAEESVAACRAYVAASEYPTSGSGKRRNLFRSQVSEAYNKFMQYVKRRNPSILYPDRTGDTIIQKHCKARCEAVKFE